MPPRKGALTRDQERQFPIDDERNPYYYQHFIDAIEAIVERWGENTEYEPGWTPLEWANDLRLNITCEVWNNQEPHLNIQKNIVKLLRDPNLVPNIYFKNFVSFRSNGISSFCPADSSTSVPESLRSSAFVGYLLILLEI